MKTLNSLSDPIIALNGQGIGELTGELLANVIARGVSDNPVRAMKVAMRIHDCPTLLELEDADWEIASEAVKADKQLTNLGKAVCMKALANGALEVSDDDKD